MINFYKSGSFLCAPPAKHFGRPALAGLPQGYTWSSASLTVDAEFLDSKKNAYDGIVRKHTDQLLTKPR